MRRLRSEPWIRQLVSEHSLNSSDLILPLFLREDSSVASEIPNLDGVTRLTPDQTLATATQAESLGIPAVALFPWVAEADKDTNCTLALNPDNLVCRTVRALKQANPNLGVICDVALDPYNAHGHDGLVSADGTILNDETLALLAQQALTLAEAGADIVAPSDMMDGRVLAIRSALEGAGHKDTKILSYAAKYASVFYGPFREAVNSQGNLKGALQSDKRTYQMNPANSDEALREVALDLAEGADLVMVKPCGPYLDIIHRVKETFRVPTFAYQVSGEYAMLRSAANAGAFPWQSALLESLRAAKRAGADAILTYGALDAAQALSAT